MTGLSATWNIYSMPPPSPSSPSKKTALIKMADPTIVAFWAGVAPWGKVHSCEPRKKERKKESPSQMGISTLNWSTHKKENTEYKLVSDRITYKDVRIGEDLSHHAVGEKVKPKEGQLYHFFFSKNIFLESCCLQTNKKNPSATAKRGGGVQ